jgi:hypothetical protein
MKISNVGIPSNLVALVNQLTLRVQSLENTLNGSPNATARIANASITDAKISSLSAAKITAGNLVVPVDVGDPASGYIRLDGVNNRIIINDGTDDRMELSP